MCVCRLPNVFFPFPIQQPTAYYDLPLQASSALPGRDLQASLTSASYVPGKVVIFALFSIVEEMLVHDFCLNLYSLIILCFW